MCPTFVGTIEMLASYEVSLAEGRGHHGRSALIDPITRKPDWREPARRNHYSAAGRILTMALAPTEIASSSAT
jgi:hypothetical protein